MSLPKIITLFIVLPLSIMQAAKAETNRGLLTWSAFQCATYAEISGDTKEQARLFQLGYETGQMLVNDLQDGTIDEAETRKIPIGIRFVLGGPSIDFVVGRIFAAAVDDAYDSIVKTDSSGLIQPDPAKWADDELKKIRAMSEFQNSNCALLGN